MMLNVKIFSLFIFFFILCSCASQNDNNSHTLDRYSETELMKEIKNDNVRAMRILAKKKIKKNQFKQAEYWFLQAVGKGDEMSVEGLCYLYLNASFIYSDNNKTLEWCSLALQTESAGYNLYYAVYMMHLRDKNIEKALALFEILLTVIDNLDNNDDKQSMFYLLTFSLLKLDDYTLFYSLMMEKIKKHEYIELSALLFSQTYMLKKISLQNRIFDISKNNHLVVNGIPIINAEEADYLLKAVMWSKVLADKQNDVMQKLINASLQQQPKVLRDYIEKKSDEMLLECNKTEYQSCFYDE